MINTNQTTPLRKTCVMPTVAPEIIAKRQAYYKANKEKLINYSRTYYQANRESIRAKNKEYQMRRLGRIPIIDVLPVNATE